MVNLTAPAANQISQEIARNLLILTNAFYAEWVEGELHKDFMSISVLHADSFHMWEYGNIRPQFLARAALIEPQARKGKKSVYSIGSHMYIAESRLEIDSYRDAPIFQQMMDELSSQNFVQLLMIKEKRTVRKLFECLTYGIGSENEFARADRMFTVIADDGLNSDGISKANSTDPMVILENSKQAPVVLATSAITGTATKALEVETADVNGEALIEDLFKLRTTYLARTERRLIKDKRAELGVIRTTRNILDALRKVANLGNADYTSMNRDMMTKYPEAIAVAGFTVVPADSTFAIYDQGDDPAVSYHNLPVNSPEAAQDYSKFAFGAGHEGSFVVAFAYGKDALIHAEVMPIQFRLFQTPQQQSMTQYFQAANDTVIINPGSVCALVVDKA